MASDPDAEAKMQEALDQAFHGEQGDFKMTQEVREAGDTGPDGRARPPTPPGGLLRRRRTK